MIFLSLPSGENIFFSNSDLIGESIDLKRSDKMLSQEFLCMSNF